mmetsp:Transcript_26285/g.71003  ORF Transcript_26285/g.71003 Transcript_26285/m.71003 type:complete len:257 (-) Transcript_26285:254-1024(-)
MCRPTGPCLKGAKGDVVSHAGHWDAHAGAAIGPLVHVDLGELDPPGLGPRAHRVDVSALDVAECGGDAVPERFLGDAVQEGQDEHAYFLGGDRGVGAASLVDDRCIRSGRVRVGCVAAHCVAGGTVSLQAFLHLIDEVRQRGEKERHLVEGHRSIRQGARSRPSCHIFRSPIDRVTEAREIEVHVDIGAVGEGARAHSEHTHLVRGCTAKRATRDLVELVHEAEGILQAVERSTRKGYAYGSRIVEGSEGFGKLCA